jgi:hypothetical protein
VFNQGLDILAIDFLHVPGRVDELFDASILDLRLLASFGANAVGCFLVCHTCRMHTCTLDGMKLFDGQSCGSRLTMRTHTYLHGRERDTQPSHLPNRDANALSTFHLTTKGLMPAKLGPLVFASRRLTVRMWRSRTRSGGLYSMPEPSFWPCIILMEIMALVSCLRFSCSKPPRLQTSRKKISTF